MNKPFISIIVPVYNVEEYLEDCLKSVVNQNFSEYEVILVDDGSTDNCPRICDAFAEKFDCFSVIHKSNGGLSSARNAGIHAAKGKYLMFLDSDDFLINNNALELIAKALYALKPDLLIGSPDEYDADGNCVIIHHSYGVWKENVLYPAITIINEMYRYNGIWVTLAQTKIISRRFCLLNKLFFSDGIYHEDDEWIARVILSRPTIAFHYQPWYGYRHRENSIVSSPDLQKKYKRTCDKIVASSSMMNNPKGKVYKEYIRYAADYFLNTIISANHLPNDQQKEFVVFLKGYRKSYRTILFSKDMKLALKALYLILFGEKSFINLYKGRKNAES